MDQTLAARVAEYEALRATKSAAIARFKAEHRAADLDEYRAAVVAMRTMWPSVQGAIKEPGIPLHGCQVGSH